MKMRPKLNKEEIPRDELQKHFPKDKPWILFLGTSHTHGSCETGVEGEEVLEDHERYTGRLKTKFPDHDIVNLAVPGNSNIVMLQQLCELNEYGIDVSNLKLVIAEVRVGDPAGTFCSDNYRDFAVHDDPQENSLLAKGSDIWHKQVRDEWLSHYATGGKMENPKYLPGLISSHFDGNPPQSAIDRLAEYIRIREEFYHTSTHTFIDDLDQVRAMQSIVRLMGVKFRWFHIDTPHCIGDSPNKVTVIDYYKKWSNLWQDRCNFEFEGFTDDKFQGVKILMNKVFTYEIFEERFSCKCRHINAEGNEIISELLYKEIKNCLNN
jgi:hypothetical protein